MNRPTYTDPPAPSFQSPSAVRDHRAARHIDKARQHLIEAMKDLDRSTRRRSHIATSSAVANIDDALEQLREEVGNR